MVVNRRAHGWHHWLCYHWTVPLELDTTYRGIRFSEEAIRNTLGKFDEIFKTQDSMDVSHHRLSVTKDDQTWTLDDEDEFLTHYADWDDAVFYRRITEDSGSSAEFSLRRLGNTTHVSGKTDQDYLKAGKRGSILSVFRLLAEYEDDCRLPEETLEPVIFIGHGRSQAWRELKDHLADKHNYRVEAYEAGARAGHAIRDILESMLKDSSFALLVLTKEDETADGGFRARQNVIQETGLFQGKLGFSRPIVVLEEGADSFSNISGIEQLRFKKIREIFGDVIATLKREFD